VQSVPVDSYIRISAKPSHPIFLAFDEIKARYVVCNISKHVSETEEKEIVKHITSIDSKTSDDELCITKDNITDMLISAVGERFSLTDVDVEKHRNTLSHFL
jgi:hypothetical protein